MLLTPSSDCGDLAPPAPGAIVAPPATVDEAMAWFAAESRPLIAACARAVEGDLGAHSWQLPWVAAPYLIRQGRWGDFAATQRAAVSAAERVGDLLGVGHTCYHLGYALALADDSPAAEQQLQGPRLVHRRRRPARPGPGPARPRRPAAGTGPVYRGAARRP